MAARPDRDPVDAPDRRRRHVAGLAVLAVTIAAFIAVVVFSGTVDPGDDPGDDATLAPADPPATTPELPATVPPTPGDGLPDGEARVTDASGDLADPDGNPPDEPEPAGDLVAVDLHADGRELTATFTVAGAIPDDVTDLLWSLHVHLDGERAYTISVQQLGSDQHTGVLDWATGEQEPLPDPPVVDEDTLTVVVPASLLDRIDGPFEWSASTQHIDTYTDYAPDLVDDTPVTEPFPG